MPEIRRNQQIETIEKIGDSKKVRGISSAKNMRGFIQGKINHFMKYPFVKYSGKDVEMLLRGLLLAYNDFHPELKATVAMEGWKGKSGIKIKQYPIYFECIEWRKTDPDHEAKKVSNKIDKEHFYNFVKALEKLDVGARYKTKEVAQIWARLNEVWKNAHGRRVFDADGFNFANIAGCRTTYMNFYYPVKIAEFYKLVKYEKRGYITRLKEDLKIQTEFT